MSYIIRASKGTEVLDESDPIDLITWAVFHAEKFQEAMPHARIELIETESGAVLATFANERPTL